MRWKTLFTDHPTSVGETYLQHLARALEVAWYLVVASVAAVVHAFIPFLFTTKASDIVGRLHDRIQELRFSGND